MSAQTPYIHAVQADFALKTLEDARVSSRSKKPRKKDRAIKDPNLQDSLDDVERIEESADQPEPLAYDSQKKMISVTRFLF